MSTPRVERLLKALLYEGYSLYPYRPSSLKNQKRWTFGALDPTQALRTQVLIAGGARALLAVEVRFLHLRGAAWQEADERAARLPAVPLGALARIPARVELDFPADPSREQVAVSLAVELSAESVEPAAPGEPTGARATGFRVTARVVNTTPGEPCPLQRNALASAHVLLTVTDGALVSLVDPPAAWTTAASACRQEGVWPVLAGEPGDASVAIASPITLHDHPEVAPESPGDLFDATEIDEILTLRILTLTDAEKRELREGDARARALLDRTEALGPEALAALHGALRSPHAFATRALRVGDRVRVRALSGRAGSAGRSGPGLASSAGRTDVFDVVLDGMDATVTAVERDLEGRVHVAVSVDEDPGRDLGAHSHRFFFAPDELERLGQEGSA